MSYIGIDLHRRFSQVHVYDEETAQESSQRIANVLEAVGGSNFIFLH